MCVHTKRANPHKKRDVALITLTLVVAALVLSGCGLLGPAEPPAAPDGLKVSAGDYADRIRVSWESVDKAGDYELERALRPGGPFDPVGRTGSTHHDDPDVKLGETYWYRVRACRRGACSPWTGPQPGYASEGSGQPPPPPG